MRKYEWHPGDPMRLRDIVIWHLCQHRLTQRLGWRLWGRA